MVLNKADSQTNTLRLAAQRVDFAVNSVDSAEAALNAFVEIQPEIVIIDARNFLSKTNSIDSKPKSSLNTQLNNDQQQIIVEPNKREHLDVVAAEVDASYICK